VEIIRQSSKGEMLRASCSRELKKLLDQFEKQIMNVTELVDAIKQQAYKENLDDFELELIVSDILKPLNISIKRKQDIRRQFRPIDTSKRPASLPEPKTPVLIDEIIDLQLPFSMFDPDGDPQLGKKVLIEIISHGKECVWVKVRKNKQEIIEVVDDDYAGI
jgi:hypothetical protein